jgi:fatty-acyl-CoA synthase
VTLQAPGHAAAREAGAFTIGALLRDQARRHPARVALEEGGRSTTYAELNARVNRLAQALAARGVGRGERVGILSENRREYVEAQLACAKLGAILACQNWRQTEEELAHCVRLAEPRAMLVSARFAERLERTGHDVPEVITLGEAFEALLAAALDREPPELAEPEDGVAILYTSGTTGLPKGAVISHRAMVARAVMARLDGNFFPDRCFVAWTPLFHMAAVDNVLAAITHGAKVILMDGFDPGGLIEIAGREELGWLSLMPGTIGRVIEEARRARLRPRSIAVIGAMPDLVPPAELAEVTTLLNAPFRNTFGSTETGSAPASAGRIPIGVAPTRMSKTQSSCCLVRLVDEEGREVPDGTPGEVAFRGPSLFSGYWRNPEANAESFRDGWFHMGDVLVRNPDGTFDFVDRRKYLIKSGGENIYPAEIERVLLAHPRIADVAVVRRPDARWGEVPVAFVLARDPGLAAEEVIAACRGRVAGYKVPREVRFVTEQDLPRSTTGKIMRHVLEQRMVAEAAR